MAGRGLPGPDALPGPAQGIASDVLAKVHVNVPKSNDHPKSGDSKDSQDSTDSTDSQDSKNQPATSHGNNPHPQTPTTTKGAEISNQAHTTDATGADKGAEISNTASDGKSHAGEHSSTTSTTGPHGKSNGPPTSVPANPHGASSGLHR